MPNLYAEMRTELLTKLKPTINGDGHQYNAGIRDALKVLDAHKEELSSYCTLFRDLKAKDNKSQSSQDEAYPYDSEDDEAENCEYYLMGMCSMDHEACEYDKMSECPITK